MSEASDMTYLFLDEDAAGRGPSGTQSKLAVELEKVRQKNRAQLGLAGLGAASVLASAVERVVLRTTATPELTYVPGAAPSQGGGGIGYLLLRLLRPDVEVVTTLGRVRLAPYGQVERSYYPLVATGLAVAGGGALYLIARGIASLYRDARPRRLSRRAS